MSRESKNQKSPLEDQELSRLFEARSENTEKEINKKQFVDILYSAYAIEATITANIVIAARGSQACPPVYRENLIVLTLFKLFNIFN